ncbi:MAG: hypothetical protein KBB53_04895 [Steroidobacteraceae bacterium]|nr:hypothetical protein [Steroidobacteraceae bacterium]
MDTEVKKFLDRPPLLGLLTPEALEVLGDNYVELSATSSGEHGLIAGTFGGAAADRFIGKPMRDGHALTFGQPFADANLIGGARLYDG